MVEQVEHVGENVDGSMSVTVQLSRSRKPALMLLTWSGSERYFMAKVLEHLGHGSVRVVEVATVLSADVLGLGLMVLMSITVLQRSHRRVREREFSSRSSML